VKLEVGSQVNALEMTPRAPANTELWSAPHLLAVSSGRAPSYTYSIPSVADRDPTFRSVTVKRTAPGVLVETMSDGSKAASADASPGDELHVDERGLVTKLVSATHVSELLFAWGDVPSSRGRAMHGVSGAIARGAK